MRRDICELDGIFEPKSSAIAGRCVVIIENADKIEDRLFDRILKTIEEPHSHTTFVLLVRQVKNVREAGQSRCVCKLTPLDDISARRFVDQALSRSKLSLNVERIKLILTASHGIPGQLIQALVVVSAADANGCRPE